LDGEEKGEGLGGYPILRYTVGGFIVATNDDGYEYKKLVVLDCKDS
jgi:hypothetical protein